VLIIVVDVNCIFAAIKAHSTKNTSMVTILPPTTSRRFAEGREDVMVSVLIALVGLFHPIVMLLDCPVLFVKQKECESEVEKW